MRSNNGYNGYSMSKRAAAAYEDGKVPFSKLPACIRKIGKYKLDNYAAPCEWHHTSKFYNRTDFYDVEQVLAIFLIESSEEYEPAPEAVEFLKNFKTTPATLPTTSFIAKKVSWLEWSGSRKHPKATCRELHNVQVFTKNNKTFSFYDGTIKITKRAGTNGFSIER